MKKVLEFLNSSHLVGAENEMEVILISWEDGTKTVDLLTCSISCEFNHNVETTTQNQVRMLNNSIFEVVRPGIDGFGFKIHYDNSKSDSWGLYFFQPNIEEAIEKGSAIPVADLVFSDNTWYVGTINEDGNWVKECYISIDTLDLSDTIFEDLPPGESGVLVLMESITHMGHKEILDLNQRLLDAIKKGPSK